MVDDDRSKLCATLPLETCPPEPIFDFCPFTCCLSTNSPDGKLMLSTELDKIKTQAKIVFFCDGKEKEVSQYPRRQTRASQKPGVTPSRAGPFTQAHVPRGFPSKLAAYARWMEQASKTVQRWKNRSEGPWARRETALGLHRPATSNAITRKWHLVPVSNSGYLRRLSLGGLPCNPRSDLSTQRRRWCQWRLACLRRMEGRWR